MPKARREHGLRAIEAARKALAAQTAAGHDPRRSAEVNRARGEAISDGHRRNRSWAREHPGQRDEAWFKREIAPKLDAFSLKEIAQGHRIIARGVLAHPSGCESSASTALGGIAGAARSRELSLSAERPQPSIRYVDQGSAENEELWSWFVRPKWRRCACIARGVRRIAVADRCAGAMPQTSTLAPHVDRGKLWMLPEAKGEDLVYVTGGCDGTCVV